MSNNAPFVSQNNYPNVTGTAPFTDQRAVIAGGGGSGDANVKFTPNASSVSGEEGKIEYENSTTGSQTPIALLQNQFTDFTLVSGAAIAGGPNSELKLTPTTGANLICRPATGNATEVNLTGTTATVTADSTTRLYSRTANIELETPNTQNIRVLSNISAQSSVIDFANSSQQPRNSPIYRFLNTQIGGADYLKFTNSPSANGDVLAYNGTGTGTTTTDPKQLVWTPGIKGLTVNFDKDISTLKLEDTTGGTTTTLSTTAVVPGRTVQIARHTINTYFTDISIFDLAAGSGSTPPGPSSKLVGNNPPRVLLDPQGNTQWQVGNSFRLTASGRLNNFTLGDRVQVKIWSNRGQTTQNLIGSFNVNTTDSSTTQIGWKMYLEFTCRTLSGGFPPVPGTFSANAQFLYSDDATVREVLGAVWVNNSTSFNTDIDQYFDVTFQLNGSTNSLAVDLAVIERLY